MPLRPCNPKPRTPKIEEGHLMPPNLKQDAVGLIGVKDNHGALLEEASCFGYQVEECQVFVVLDSRCFERATPGQTL